MSSHNLIVPDEAMRLQAQQGKSYDITTFFHLGSDINLILHVCGAVERALINESGINPDVADLLKVNGFSGVSFRHLLNNIATFPGTHYLEVGTYCGSSLCSVLSNNLETVKSAIAIDNWSEFTDHVDPKVMLEKYLGLYIPNADDTLTLYEEDCFLFDKTKIKNKINLYFYDGAHTAQDQERAFTYFDEVLDDVFVAVVDDWEQGDVRKGTLAAFEKLRYNVLASWQIFPNVRERKTENPHLGWWLGAFVAVVKKNNTRNVDVDNYARASPSKTPPLRIERPVPHVTLGPAKALTRDLNSLRSPAANVELTAHPDVSADASEVVVNSENDKE